MSNDMWLKRWEEKNIGWHEKNVNPFLEKNFHLLNLEKNQTVFIPLCGKTLDIAWFLSQGINVIGCELSDLAINDLFNELEMEPNISVVNDFKMYSAQGITIFEGDIFNLTGELLGEVDVIYDRAALVALSSELRTRYTELLRTITSNAKQFLITVCYEQHHHNKPPFSIPIEEIELHYKEFYSIKQIESIPMAGGFKGLCDASDEVWILS